MTIKIRPPSRVRDIAHLSGIRIPVSLSDYSFNILKPHVFPSLPL
jgi:hypothetical protein